MQKLSEANKLYLESRGISFFEHHNRCMLVKKMGAEGNRIEGYSTLRIATVNDKGETISEIISDCPMMQLWYEENGFTLTCMDWVPGPGPGNFTLPFTSEAELMSFIESYYFGQNEYFEARKEDFLKRR